MIRFFRRVFGRKGPSIIVDEREGDEQFDPETQEMILSSFDLLEHIVARGGNLTSEHVVSHFFAGEPSNVARAAPAFRDMGFRIDIPERHLLHVVGRASLSRQWVEQTIPTMCRLAGEFELNYDGWDCGAELGPDEQTIIMN